MKSLVWMIAILMFIVITVFGLGLGLDLVLAIITIFVILLGSLYMLAPKENKYFNWIYKIL